MSTSKIENEGDRQIINNIIVGWANSGELFPVPNNCNQMSQVAYCGES